ncbi:MAG: ATP-binding protein [Patescibacteria group bacterium]
MLPLLGAIFTLTLGFFVWIKKPKSHLSILFFLYSFALTVWLYGTFELFNAGTDANAIFWDRFIYAGVVFIPIFLYHFGLLYCEIKNQQTILKIGYVLAVAFLPLTQTDYLVKDLFKYAWGVHTRAQPLHIFFLVYFFFYFIYYFVNLYRSYAQTEGLKKQQMKFMLIGFFILDAVGPLAFLPAYGISVYPVIFLSAIPFALIVAYAMVKYQALNVKILSVEVFSALITILSLYEFFFSTSFAETLFRLLALIFVIFFVFMLLRSVHGEVSKREKIELLNNELNVAAENLKQQNQALKESKARELAKARDVAKLRDEFVFLAAHELKAPVFAIRGFLELVQDEGKKVPISMRDNLDSIAQASEHLNHLVSDLLQVARQDSGTMTVATTALSTVKLFESVMNEQVVLAQKRKIVVTQEIADIFVMADENKLKEVLTNLVNNGIKYNREKGSLSVRVTSVKGNGVIEVKDSGFGIPKDQQAKIFQKFFRAGGKATEGVLGTGLGLFITKMLVEKMGGTISFASEEGKGTTFILKLPLANGQTSK